MKLGQIINASHIEAELSTEKVTAISKHLANAELVKMITSTVELAKHEQFYCARRDGKILAWIELGGAIAIHGDTYETAKFVYAVPEVRGTLVVGAFLLALKGELQHPLVLGADEYGGVLFAEGQDLVKALHQSARFTVSGLDLRTGKLTPFSDSDLRGAYGKTLVFERGDFPLYADAGVAGKFHLFEA